MRILFAHNNADLYGSSRSLLRLAARLVRDGHAVRVILPAEGALSRALRDHAVPVEADGCLAVLERQALGSVGRTVRLALAFPGSVRRFCAHVDAFRPEVVHTNTSVVLSPGVAARLRGVPHVWHMREFYVDFPRLWPLYRRYLARFADRIVCVSEAVARQFPDRLRRDGRLVVLHNGLPADEFPVADAVAARTFRDSIGVQDETLIGAVGRIKLRRKGQESFVDAAARLAARFPDARFVIVGAPSPGNEYHAAELRRQAQAAGVADRVLFAGEREDMRPVYAALDVVVLPSGQPEPFGGTVLEAMAAGKPVVGTDVGGTPEQIDDGRTGLLVPANAPDALAEAIGRLLASPPLRAAMGTAARARYSARFEFEPFYRQMTAIYAAERSRPYRGTVEESPPAPAGPAHARRVLLIHNFYRYFGGEDSIALREKALLTERGDHVWFYSRHNREIERYGLWRRVRFAFATLSSRATARDIRRIAAVFRPDVAYVHNVFPLVSPSVYRALHRAGVPCVQNVQDYRWLCPNGLFYNRLGICERCRHGEVWNAVRFRCFRDSVLASALYACVVGLNRRLGVLNRIQVIACSTPYIREQFAAAGVAADRLFVKPNFVVAPARAADGGGATGDATDGYAIFLGRLSAEKGLWTLVKAFETLPDIPLRIVGTGPLEADVRAYVAARGLRHIACEGFRDGEAKERLLRDALFMVFTSEWYEHFPIVLLEAFAAEKAAIVPRLGNMPYIVEDGVTGLHFEAGNADDLRAKVRLLAGDRNRCRALGRLAGGLVRHRYGPDENYRQLAALFDTAVATARASGRTPAGRPAPHEAV